MPASSELPVGVVGAGITGLTAAWHLHRRGRTVTVFDAAPSAGGAIRSHHAGGWLHEAGPNSLLEGSPTVATFIQELGLISRRTFAANAAANRYVVRDGRLIAMPVSPAAFLRSQLFSARAKLSLLGEPFRARSSTDDEECVAKFVERRLGREFLDYAVNPLVGGVYAGDPSELSVRYAFPKLHALEQKHGSLILGGLKQRNASGGPKGRMFSFPEGLVELPRAIVEALGESVRLSTRVRQVRRDAEGWEITSESHAGIRADRFSAVICALPPDALASLNFREVAAAGRLSELSAIKQPPVVSVFMGFRRDQVAHPLDGFGFLVPEIEGRNILGTLFSSALFPGRAPAGMVGLTTFVGGVRSPGLASLNDPDLARLVKNELRELLGANGSVEYTHIHRWSHAIPQYTVGYGRYHGLFSAVEKNATGLFIGGNARDGISIANCIESGIRLARAVG